MFDRGQGQGSDHITDFWPPRPFCWVTIQNQNLSGPKAFDQFNDLLCGGDKTIQLKLQNFETSFEAYA